jgi:hypothetical protein
MSVRTIPIKKVVNSIEAGTVAVSSGVVTIRVPNAAPVSFLAADVRECSRTCAVACTPGVWTVTPIVPSTPCNCPFIWELTISGISCSGQVGLVGEGNFNGGFGSYTASLPSGVTPTVSEIIQQIVLAINSDPYRVVNAVAVGDPGEETAITITERNCQTEYVSGMMRRTCGVRIISNSATIVNGTPHVDSIYSSNDAYRDFPVGFGQFGLRSDLTACGAYCKFYFRIVPDAANMVAHMADHGLITREMELEYVVNTQDADYVAMWNNELAAVITCIPAI